MLALSFKVKLLLVLTPLLAHVILSRAVVRYVPHAPITQSRRDPPDEVIQSNFNFRSSAFSDFSASLLRIFINLSACLPLTPPLVNPSSPVSCLLSASVPCRCPRSNRSVPSIIALIRAIFVVDRGCGRDPIDFGAVVQATTRA